MYRETDKFFLWNWVFTLKSKMYWVYRSAVLNWVFVKFILGNTTFSLYFLYKNWINIPQNSLSISPDRTLRKQTCIMD